MIFKAEESDLAFIEALLIDEALPAGDFTDAEMWIVRNERPIGCFGFQFFGTDALFRSMAVVSTHRGNGLGSAIMEKAISIAQERGVERLWLLTDRTEDYFAKRGFEKVERISAPECIQRTAQFKTFCSPSAKCMVREL